MEIKVKLNHKDAKLPTRANPGDAGWDLTAVSERFDILEKYFEYDLGISLAIPEGYVGLIFPRSSISKKDMSLANSVGVIDSGFRGNITARLKPTTNVGMRKYSVGDKIAQLVVVEIPKVEFKQVEELDNTVRGTGGYGSSGS